MSKRHKYVTFGTTENCLSPLLFVRIPVGSETRATEVKDHPLYN